MSPASILLRLLLAACLVITTTGGALASMQMQLMQGASSSSMASDALASADSPSHEAKAAPCHEDAAATQTDLHSPGSPADHADCCLAGNCDGICLLSLPPLPASTALAALPLSQPSLAEAHADHPAPRLTRPQRPPIA